jgi:hypothetical protein
LGDVCARSLLALRKRLFSAEGLLPALSLRARPGLRLGTSLTLPSITTLVVLRPLRPLR